MRAVESGDFPAGDTALEEAAVWIARLNAGEITIELLGDLRAWMEESPGNRAALRRMEHLWSRLAVVQFAIRQIYADLETSEH